ncbi:hypothetical protein M0R04_08895 [Candidatus Dojkabacteria bacterium]|jgi:hypothetical protein|nr:hypothetical protein [Candidatus Dojkabacteria bacterium]
MKLKLYLFFVFVIMFVTPLISALDSPQIFKQYEPANLTVQCIINGSYCSTSATCNVTVLYPNGGILINNKRMTNQHSYHNYSLPDTAVIGDYKCTAICCDIGYCGDNDCDFKITSTGDDSNWSFWIILALFSATLVGLAIYSGNEYMMYMAAGAITITGIYSRIYGIMGISDIYTQSISYVIIGIGIFFLIISVLKAIADASDEKGDLGGWGPGGEDYDFYKE